MRKIYILLFLVVILSFVLRFYELGEVPKGFTMDEASIGYDAYSILKTGRDQWGNFLPLVFKSLGDNKNPVYIYLTTIPVAIFGLNEFATRFIASISSVFLTFVVFFLVREVLRTEEKEQKNSQVTTIALLSALLFAISPWAIFLGRIAAEATLGTLFFATGLLFFLKGLRKKEKLTVATSLTMFILSTISYHSQKLFVPTMVLALLFIYRKVFFSSLRSKIAALSFLFLVSLSLISSFLSQNNRLSQITYIRNIGIENSVNEQRGQCLKSIPTAICKFAFNKPTAISIDILKNYLNHYSLSNLFTEGVPGNGYSMEGYGLMYIMALPFFLIGIFWLLIKRKRNHQLLLSWLLLYPLPSALAGGDNPARMLVFLPLPQIVAAAGMVELLTYIEKMKKTLFLTTTATIFFFSVSLTKYLINYFYVYPAFSSRVFQYGYEPLVRYLATKENSYEKIIISRRYDDSKQYMFLLFYDKVNPVVFQTSKEATFKTKNDGWIWVERVGKYYFQETIPVKESIPPKSLLVGTPNEFPSDLEPIHKIDDLKGDSIFYFVESDSLNNYYKQNKTNDRKTI